MIIENMTEDKLIPNRQPVFIKSDTGTKHMVIDGYQLPGYESFSFRLYADEYWVLSIRGRMVTYGSYSHLIDVVMLLVKEFKCWHSETSLTYFLGCEQHVDIIDEIIKLRDIDHTLGEL